MDMIYSHSLVIYVVLSVMVTTAGMLFATTSPDFESHEERLLWVALPCTGPDRSTRHSVKDAYTDQAMHGQ